MSNIDIQTVVSSRFRTSQEADKITGEMWQALGLETKAQFARLAIGRSLAMGQIEDETPDSKALEIPAQALFTIDNIGAWIGLLVAHAINSNSRPVNDHDSLRVSIRSHWHRGAKELYKDWHETGSSYDKFIEVLISRRSEMPEEGKPRAEDEGKESGGKTSNLPTGKLSDESALLVKGLEQLNIKVQVKDAIFGPRMTRYRVLLLNLNDRSKLDKSLEKLALAMNLGDKMPAVANGDEAMTVFIDVPRPRDTWITVPFEKVHTWLKDKGMNSTKLNCYVGVTVTGEDVAFDLTSAPHLLVGGTTNSGKSVSLHSLILSLLLQHREDTLQLALIDPKRVEFSPYQKLKNLYKGQIAMELTESKAFLSDLVSEMESRYLTFEQMNVSNISEAIARGKRMPYIVVFIEELADLTLQDRSIEQLLERLAQKARAAGIHLVLATQRPDSDTFSGLIRSNIPARIALTVQKGTESKIILDETGAENLLGSGDMLLKLPGEQPKRAHGVFISKELINQVLTTL